MTTSTATDSPRIYVACLASYNNGVLHGAWIDADKDADDIQEDVNEMLRASRFPNVTVPCPICMGNLATEPGQPACEACHGRGEVPSAEEWAIHDYEGFEGIKLEEYESFEKVSELAKLLAEHGEAFAAYVNSFGDGYADDMGEDFQERYRGTFRSVADYAEEFVTNCYDLKDVPDFIKYHIDYEGIGRDFELGGDISSQPGGDGVFIFDNH